MTKVDKCWQTVVSLVVGVWCKCRVKVELVQHQHVLYKNWKAVPFILLALSLGQQKELHRKNVFYFVG